MRQRLLQMMCGIGLSMASSAALAAGYGAAGCGLGSVIFGPEPGLVQVLAATTNGSSYSQTFGITSGTSNCIPRSKAAAFNLQKDFLSQNFASISVEAAQGQGETLTAFAATLGCGATGTQAVAHAMQASHGEIFRNPGVDRVLFSVHEVLRADAQANQACQHLI